MDSQLKCPNCGTGFQVVFESKQKKRASTMSVEDRKATGIRLQTARATKLGLTLEQYRELHLRPGQQPTAEDLARVKGEAKKPAAKKPKK